MPSRLTKEKAEAIAEEYCTNGYNKAKALEDVGYKSSYANSGAREATYNTIQVKQAIDDKMAEISQKIEHNYEKAVRMLLKRLSWLDKSAKAGNTKAINAQTAIIRELDCISGLQKREITSKGDAAPKYTPEQLAVYEDMAREYKQRLKLVGA